MVRRSVASLAHVRAMAAHQWVCAVAHLLSGKHKNGLSRCERFWLNDSLVIYSINTATENTLTAARTCIWRHFCGTVYSICSAHANTHALVECRALGIRFTSRAPLKLNGLQANNCKVGYHWHVSGGFVCVLSSKLKSSHVQRHPSAANERQRVMMSCVVLRHFE